MRIVAVDIGGTNTKMCICDKQGMYMTSRSMQQKATWGTSCNLKNAGKDRRIRSF